MTKRKNAGEGYGYTFHGSFSDKADAVKKESKTKGSFIKGTPTQHGYRWVVMKPRKNPPRSGSGKKSARRVNKTKPRVMTYSLESKFGGRKRKATKVVFPDGREFKFDERLPKRTAIKEAIRELGLGNNPAALGLKNPVRFEVVEVDANRKSRVVHSGLTRPEANDARKRLRAAYGSYGLRFAVRPVQAAANNPVELLVMGANPGGAPLVRHNTEFGEFDKGVFHPWTRRPKTRRKPAMRRLKQVNPAAADLRESFVGRPAEWVTIKDEPHMPAGDYAKLGDLLVLYVKPKTGGQVLEIHPRKTIVVADETAEQIYFVGGDQDIRASLESFGAVDRGGVFELGEVRRIDYKQRKEHVPDPDVDEWRHNFGEETGEKPVLLFDPRTARLLLEGGAYEIRPEGIVN